MFHSVQRRYKQENPLKLAVAKAQTDEPRGKAAAPYLPDGTLLGKNKSFCIEKLIAGGGFGQIFRAIDLDSNTVLAVKVEREKPPESARMVLEAQVLDELQGVPHFPRIFYMGHACDCNYIVMQMLGRNLTDIRKALPTKRFSVHSTVRVGIQIVQALRSLHDRGYLHRDVKPTNVCVGIDAHRRQMFLVDFGMARPYRRDDGSCRMPRAYAGFRGTQRYASINVHDRLEQGRVDDLWGLYYSLVELSESSLPWKSLETADEVAQLKRRLRYVDICRHLPDKFGKFERHLRRTDRLGEPDYDRLISYLMACCKFVDTSAEFEWDED